MLQPGAFEIEVSFMLNYKKEWIKNEKSKNYKRKFI